MTGPAAEQDRDFLTQALALAAMAEGTTHPNPRVGCVLVREGRVVGRGYHRHAGGPHAEALAVAEAGGRAAGATLYVSLEPCAHHGRTPPCVDLLIRAGVRRVVAALQDPDPRVDGRGFERLRRAGIEVTSGLLAEPARRLNDAFVHRHRHGLPLVTLKAAVSLDGLLSAGAGESRWITGAPARRVAHRLRLRHDAVLVGAGTVRRDDPRLTVRLPGEVGRGPLRVVLSRSLDLDPRARLFDEGPAPVRIYAGPRADERRGRRLAGRAEIVRVASGGDEGALDLRAVLKHLAADGIQSLLVEGGGKTIASLLTAGLADRAALFIAPRLLGARGATPLVDAPAVAVPEHGIRFVRRDLFPLGEDLLALGDIEPLTTEEAPCSPA